ncbi:OmpA family protein [Swingsia samuiensis]|uniref:OmpA-like domain-containing protein n=1 Tax=Swingsia samuiensis TaxID=1293412 RepID=A0A4Y6UJ21_9PROT|nr:OmpA family protein [Swingsia samuiensis]QDH16357.1 hypothetical protein E3D00_01340 [Swingsia samuiensis]
MTQQILYPLSLAALLTCFSAAPALAQVSSNLDNLPKGTSTEPAKHTTSKKSHTSTSHKTTHHSGSATPHASHSTPTPAKEQHNSPSSQKRQPIPSVPQAPPPPVVIPPPFVPVQIHPPVPPENIKAVANAQTHVIQIPDDKLRVTFSSESSDFNDAAIKAIQNYGATLKEEPEKRIILVAYATLPGDDISMPRRIALARALALRSILIQSGIATTRIYPRAMGRPTPGDTNPPDRVEVFTESNPSPSAPEHSSP